MRLLHTSDWHLGRSLLSVPMLEHQQAFLRWLTELAVDEGVDAVIVAGDVFDRAVPPVDAVLAFEKALVDLTEVCPVVVISGNHDSPTRLGFASALLERAGVHIRSTADDIGRPVHVIGADGESAWIYGIPYLHPELHFAAFDCDRSHEGVLSFAMERIRTEHEDVGPGWLVVASHAFVVGGTSSDSEREVTVGGIGDVPSAVFAGADYVALGHLHRPQEVAMPGDAVARYSGSPLAYSFSEEGQSKSVVLVDLSADEPARTRLVDAPVPRSLATITGDLDYLLTSDEFTDYEPCWVRAVITDQRRPPEAMDRLRGRFPHAIELSYEPRVDGQPVERTSDRVDVSSASPIEVARHFVVHVTNAEPSAGEVIALEESITRVLTAQVAQ